MTEDEKLLIQQHEQLVKQVGDQVKRLLAGHDPFLQSAVLADLTALWIVGNLANKAKAGLGIDVADYDSKETLRLQAELLKGHVELIQSFIPANVHYLITHHGELPVRFY